ncbi:DUF29 domain-containing protein [Massilia endophytica]|uniref:DUF29 domain-containing protein n=1 Tax=Massilia endophytica TaxID=2899220 RepID=UPI001E5B0C9D|nr:DUF29 domain-containing protein [Massilia endophytica]UGQ45061.1 DUF29 domain-containing protein [Massilia endophytica]
MKLAGASEAVPLYEDDFALWAESQAAFLRDRRFELLDIPNLFDEIASMAGHQRHELRSRLVVLLAHLLKAAYQPERMGKSWRATIRLQRREIGSVLMDSPSLRRELPAMLAYAYPHAVAEAVDETGLPKQTFPADCPYTLEEVLG